MKIEDNERFKWCITRALNPVDEHPERITKDLRNRPKSLNWSGLEFPVSLKDIDKFERNNVEISIYVFGYEDGIYPPCISKYERKNVVDLLLISKDTTNRYCVIKSLNRLLSSQSSGHRHARLYCRRRLNDFDNKEAFTKHKEYCNQHEAARMDLPEPGTMLTFQNLSRSMRVPFIVYADFESFIKSMNTCQPDPSISYTKQYQKHTLSSFCNYIKCFNDNIYKCDPVTFTAEGENDEVAGTIVDTLEAHIEEIYNQFKFPKRMIFTEDDKKRFNEATVCHICEKRVQR